MERPGRSLADGKRQGKRHQRRVAGAARWADRPARRCPRSRDHRSGVGLLRRPRPAGAGGCVLALQADVRIGADRDARIGLNETQLGIGLPLAVVETLRWQVPGPSLAPLALEGRLVSPREALQLGLLHEVVPEADLLTRALERATTLAALPPAGLRMVKESLRKPAAAAARANESAESERWLDTWFSADSQRKLREAVARLKK